ncbi:MAG: hypothetical protein LW714_06345 [Oxalobacteraceae bacterium]|nr:hypothetical protein [Oxalobacteraceae bacterium]
MKRLLFVVLMMSCSVSWAEWELTGKADDLTHYHDKSTIQINDITAQMWVMYEFPEVRTNTDGDKYKSAKTLLAFNCKYETLTMISVVQYSGSAGNGEIILTDTFKESEWIWDRIVPNSLENKELDIACGKK